MATSRYEGSRASFEPPKRRAKGIRHSRTRHAHHILLLGGLRRFSPVNAQGLSSLSDGIAKGQGVLAAVRPASGFGELQGEIGLMAGIREALPTGSPVHIDVMVGP